MRLRRKRPSGEKLGLNSAKRAGRNGAEEKQMTQFLSFLSPIVVWAFKKFFITWLEQEAKKTSSPIDDQLVAVVKAALGK